MYTIADQFQQRKYFWRIAAMRMLRWRGRFDNSFDQCSSSSRPSPQGEPHRRSIVVVPLWKFSRTVFRRRPCSPPNRGIRSEVCNDQNCQSGAFPSLVYWRSSRFLRCDWILDSNLLDSCILKRKNWIWQWNSKLCSSFKFKLEINWESLFLHFVLSTHCKLYLSRWETNWGSS